MNKLKTGEQKDKLLEAMMYSIGEEYANIVSDETDNLVKEHDEVEVPNSLTNWFEKYNRKLEQRKNIRTYGKRAAVFLIVSIISLSALTISVDAWRMKFFNMLIEINNRYSIVTFEETESSLIFSSQDIPEGWTDYYPTVIPEGYTLNTFSTTSKSSRLVYSNNENKELKFHQQSIGVESHMDTENAVVYEVEINGFQGVMIEKNEQIMIRWHNEEYGFLLTGYLEKEIMLDIAESIERK